MSILHYCNFNKFYLASRKKTKTFPIWAVQFSERPISTADNELKFGFELCLTAEIRYFSYILDRFSKKCYNYITSKTV